MRKRRETTECSGPSTTRLEWIRADKSHFTCVQQWTQNSPWVSLVPKLGYLSLPLVLPGVPEHKRHYWDTLCIPYSRCFIRKKFKGIYFSSGPKNIILYSSLCTSITKQNSVILTKETTSHISPGPPVDHSQLSTLFSCLFVFVINSSSCFVCFFTYSEGKSLPV